MKEERLKILELLADQKISSDEAVKLLEALTKTQSFEGGFHHKPDHSDEIQERLSKLGQSLDSFAKEFGDKVSVLAKDMEPKAKKFGKMVAEKTAAAADEISKALNKAFETNECCKDECCDEKKEDCCEETKEEDCCCQEKKEEPCCDTKVDNDGKPCEENK